MTDAGPRTLGRRMGTVSGSLAVSQVLTGLVYVLAARTLGPTEFGKASIVIAVGSVLAGIVDFGLSGYFVREIASESLPLRSAVRMVAAKRAYVVLLSLLVAACGLYGSDPILPVLCGLLIWSLWESLSASAFLRAQERFGAVVFAQLCGRVVGTLSAIALFTINSPMLALFCAIVVGYIGEAILATWQSRAVCIHGAHRQLWQAQRDAVGYGLASLSSMSQQLDTPLVAAGGGIQTAGLYAAAGRMLSPLGMLSSSMSSVAAPALARVRGDSPRLAQQEWRVGRIVAALSLAPLVVALVGPAVVPWLLGEDFRSSGAAFAVLAIGTVVSTMNQGLAVALQNRARQGFVAAVVAIGLTCGLLATYVLAHSGEAAVAAIGFVLSQMIILIGLGCKFVRIKRGEK